MSPEDYRIRRATAADALPLLTLMRELAVFEGYIDDFRVTAGQLTARGLREGTCREFTAWVAEESCSDQLCGYAVYLVTPFTYDLRPTFTLKELFVAVGHRRRGLAEALFEAVRADAVAAGAGRVRWLVLPSNDEAKRFYLRLGGKPEAGWESWQMSLPNG